MKRKLPRKFQLPFGKGKITEEVSILCPHWEPTLQLLEFDKGEKALRICYYHQNRFGRSPLIIDKKDWKRLMKEVNKNKKIRKILK